MIIETVGIDPDGIVLRMGASSAPGARNQAAGLADDRVFELDGSGTRLYHKFRKGDDLVVVQLKSESEVEYRSQATIDGRFRTLRTRLFKRTG